MSREKDATSGRSKTVDTKRFIEWVENRLLPVLGRYEKGEARSVVILDNASIHHDDEIVDLIESTGARVIYTAPYSSSSCSDSTRRACKETRVTTGQRLTLLLSFQSPLFMLATIFEIAAFQAVNLQHCPTMGMRNRCFSIPP